MKIRQSRPITTDNRAAYPTQPPTARYKPIKIIGSVYRPIPTRGEEPDLPRG